MTSRPPGWRFLATSTTAALMSVTLAVPGLAGPLGPTAQPVASDWTEVAHQHGSGQDSYLYDSWSTGNEVWHAGVRRSYVGGVYEWRTLVQRCSGSSCTPTYPRDIEAPPNTSNWLQGISGTSPSDVWVVGSARHSGPPATTRPAIHHWNGTAWTMVENPIASGALYGVSAKAPNDVWAVGYSYANFTQTPLVLHWNGSAWSTIAFSVPGCTPYDLARDIAADGRWPLVIGECRAQDGQPEAMVASYRGGAWVREPIPAVDPFEVDYTAVAWVGKEAWIGGRSAAATLTARLRKKPGWSTHLGPVPGSVYGIAGAKPRDVWAVGSEPFPARLTMHWNGRRWRSVDATEDPGWFETVAITESGVPWAGGQEFGQSLIARYDGPLADRGRSDR